MFVSQESGAKQKPYQKPNILRKKSNLVRHSTQKKSKSPEIMPLMYSGNEIFVTPSLGVVEPTGRFSPSLQIVQPPQLNFGGVHKKEQGHTNQTVELNSECMTVYAHKTQNIDNNSTFVSQSTLNVESFLNDGAIKQNDLLENEKLLTEMETDSKQKWCLDFMNEVSKDTVTTNYYDGSQVRSIYVNNKSDLSRDEAAVAPSPTYETNAPQGDEFPAQQLSIDSVSYLSGPIKFKCDVPNCNKSFWTEVRLQMHKNAHINSKEKLPTILTCPVKKTDADGVETKCNKTFLVRSQLMNHLNKDHSPEEALYRCGACGRRFFWAGGARAHQAGACERAFPCMWAGCGRVFRQPCRLREHARAHTGDRPYPCHYPNCGWAFRSASKLVRHERRHTGERRHVCAAAKCGRAFLRREHLRDHVARHHARGTDTNTHPAHHVCTHTGCEQTFKSSSSLVNHQKKVHMKNEGRSSAPKRAQKNAKAMKEMFVVNLVDTHTAKLEADVETEAEIKIFEHSIEQPVEQPTCVEDDVSMDCDVTEREGRCARTHCTWPLERQHSEYMIEDDDQVEQSESSESNIYTVRSDLFLHGNVLINEDSEFIRIGGSVADGGAVVSEEVEGQGEREGQDGGEGGGSLGLIDAHPTIDLMQEELMYADAVDESSFRVFLLNGEELT